MAAKSKENIKPAAKTKPVGKAQAKADPKPTPPAKVAKKRTVSEMTKDDKKKAGEEKKTSGKPTVPKTTDKTMK